MFDLKGKIIATSESECQPDCSKGDNVCTSPSETSMIVVSKSSAVTTADASDKRQQQQDSTSSTSTLATTITADGNFDFQHESEEQQMQLIQGQIKGKYAWYLFNELHFTPLASFKQRPLKEVESENRFEFVRRWSNFMEYVKKSIDERALHKMEYDSRTYHDEVANAWRFKWTADDNVSASGQTDTEQLEY
ncbi:hypothetical protein Tco_1318025 [Tanacetum coccineum]